MLAKEIWDTLSKVDVSEHIEKKGNLSYLSWAWAWAEFMKNFPQAEYLVNQVHYFEDGSAEVSCEVLVETKEETVRRQMWLPVLNHSNKAVKNPDAFAINTSKMRCLVKCLAMFGLGHYIYAGEDLPEQEDYKTTYSSSTDAIRAGIASGDLSSAAEEWYTLPKHVQAGLWVATSKGGAFSTKEREIMKSSEFRQAHYGEEK